MHPEVLSREVAGLSGHFPVPARVRPSVARGLKAAITAWEVSNGEAMARA
jgi:hypothetical protein